MPDEFPRHPFHSLVEPPETPFGPPSVSLCSTPGPGPGHTFSSQGAIDGSLLGKPSSWIRTESFKSPSYKANSVYCPGMYPGAASCLLATLAQSLQAQAFAWRPQCLQYFSLQPSQRRQVPEQPYPWLSVSKPVFYPS